MAWETPKSKTTVFPMSNKIKTFVRDVASLKRPSSGHSRAKSVASFVTESEQAWSIASDFDCPEEHPEHKAGISVQLSLSFEDPLEFSCNRCYNSSADFEPSERLLRGLLRRIDHGSFELITRKDPVATAATRGDGRLKPKRFEMSFQISQKGSVWATRTYTSYQKDAMNANSVKEVVLSSHRLIGLFLRRHDPHFAWRDGPIRDELPEGPETSPYRVGGLQPMTCIPRSRFLEKTQAFEAIPGFKIELSITSRSQRRKPPEGVRTIEIESNQTTPLNLAVAEALFSNASYALEAALRQKRRTVEDRHRQTCGFISPICQHYEENATSMELRVTNNLGPQFDHLHRTVAGKLVLFSDIDSHESTDFFNNIERALGDARDTADHTISETNDFEFRIVELRGRGWNIDEPLVFTLGPADSYSRRSVQAILDRVQAGVADVLRGNVATVRMSAAKRGHYILDKTLLAPRDPNAGPSAWSIPSRNKAKVVDNLRRRVHQDIDMICKDTCSLDNLDEKEPTTIRYLPSKVDVLGQSEFEAVKVPLPSTPSPGPNTMLWKAAEIHASVPASHDVQRPQSSTRGREDAPSISGSHQERPKPRSFTYLKNGGRAFPLVPLASSYGFTEMAAPASSEQNADRPLNRASNEAAEAKSGNFDSTTKSETQPTNPTDTEISKSTLVIQQSHNDSAPTKSLQSSAHASDVVEPEQRRASLRTLDNRKYSDPEEISLAPSTPSLVYGSGHSTRSSVYLYTPQIQGTRPDRDVDVILASGTSDSHDDYHEYTEIGTVQKFPRPVEATSPPSSRGSSSSENKPSPSPLQQEEPMSDETISAAADVSNNDSSNPISNTEPEHSGQGLGVTPGSNSSSAETVLGNYEAHEKYATVPEPSSDATIDESVREVSSPELPPMTQNENIGEQPGPQGDLHAPNEQAEQSVDLPGEFDLTEGLRTPTDRGRWDIRTPSDGFAQTRQELDFDFSSPWSASSPYSEASYSAFYANLDNAIDDDAEDSGDNNTNKLMIPRSLSSSLVCPPLFSRTRQRRSFGSAGLLGIRVGEPRLIDVGWRRALMIPMIRGMGGSPTTAMSLLSSMKRQGGEKAALLMRRPASSHGNERSPLEPDMESAIMKRSASSGLLQDMVVVEAKKSTRPRDHKTVRKDEKRDRSSGVMFQIAKATLASQLRGNSR
ncbi:hypothetical protein TruAng_004680 [Truncatella angustata]|nr:hypothetical protein TruAng_004680 [Truncatella angustata]